MSFIDTSKDLGTLFLNQARATPDSIAVEDESRTYTYAELETEVTKLAIQLRARGARRDSLVGVLLPRCANYVITCLAALRAGGAFLVLELAYPQNLLDTVIEDANPSVIVTYRSEVGKIRPGASTIVLDEEHATIDHIDTTEIDLPTEIDLERLSFVAYSSGTTGKPKGIANPHTAPLLSYNLRFGISDLQPGNRVACNVFFVWEILRPLFRGATTICVPDETSYDPVALVDLLAAKNITETLMTPTLLASVLVRYPDIGDRLPKLRTLWLNGEVVTADLARRALAAMPNIRLLNCYSACETHEIACGDIKEMLDEKSIYCPVGKPFDPAHTYILDDSGRRVESGIVGELFIGGHMLARGYINLPEITAQAFTSDEFDSASGARKYRTGDLARILPSGVLEITGRVGAMIKLRGYSVVPGKVESTIKKVLAVRDCAVRAFGEGLDRQLVAYVVPDLDDKEGRQAIELDGSGRSPAARKALSPHLAQYMLPTLWVELDKLPVHGVSGKVDLNSLPAPPSQTPVTNGRSIEVDHITADAIAEVWAATLKVSRSIITPEHSFFDLGGHSLSLADLAARLSRMFGFRIPVARLADPTTLNGHLQTVRSVRDGELAAVQADLPATLRIDSVLDKDIWPESRLKAKAVKDADTILLTGATGFLGAFILIDLLEQTSANIICLVRFDDPSEDDKPAAISRIRKNLILFGLWSDSIMDRVEVLPGNLSRKRMGLSNEAFQDLSSRIQVIFHAAATVNLVYPYAALRAANVGGTREILRLACIHGATLHHISSNGVLPPSASGDGWPEDAMLYVDSVPEKIPDGYGQTKWAAEQLVHEAGRRGLPVKIYRAGTISGHSATGSANAWDLLTAIFVESIQLGYAPDVVGWRAEMTPVDFVSRAIVHLANQIQAKQLVFHLGDPDPVDAKQVFKDLDDLGYPTKPLEFEKWVTLWNKVRGSAKGGEGAFTVDILRSGMPMVEFLKNIVILNNAQTRPFRANVERPKVDNVLMETYARHWYARGWLPNPPSTQYALGGSAYRIGARNSILHGRVAVITGASSGIGAAVAAALAKEGCHLALAARRTDALEKVKRCLTIRDGKVITKQTDVTQQSQVEALFRAAEEELGPVDILVSCAGVMYYTMMSNTQTESWTQTVDVNCKGLLYCLSASLSSMLARRKGHIVAISSDAGRKVFPGLGVYSASKFFIEATLQSLRLETVGSGLRVTSVQPGNVATDLLAMSTDQEAIEKYGQPSGARVLDAEDVANAIVYALRQPEHVAVNEVLVEPRDEPI